MRADGCRSYLVPSASLSRDGLVTEAGISKVRKPRARGERDEVIQGRRSSLAFGALHKVTPSPADILKILRPSRLCPLSPNCEFTHCFGANAMMHEIVRCGQMHEVLTDMRLPAGHLTQVHRSEFQVPPKQANTPKLELTTSINDVR